MQLLARTDSFWLMTYQHGGFANHCHVVLSVISDGKIKYFKTGISITGPLKTITEIKKAFSDKKIEFKDPNTEE